MTSRSEKQLEILQVIARHLSEGREARALFQAIAPLLQQVFGDPKVTVLLRDRGLGEFRLDGAPLPVDNPASLRAPLRGGSVHGELSILAPSASAFEDDDGRMLVTVADLVASVLLQDRLYGQVLETNARLARLDDLSRTINTQQDVDGIVGVAALGLGDLVGADAFGLYTISEGLPSLLAWQGPPGIFPQSIELVGENGRRLIGRPGSHQFQLGAQQLHGRHLLVELLRGARDSILGVVAIRLRVDAEEVPEEVRPLISALAGHVAVAVENVRLLSEMRHQATYDHLTGLSGRRHFFSELSREIARARRNGRPLSMLMIDADHFKSLNDTHGHLAGDLVLRSVADLLREGTRTIDVLGRLGGEELGVLLPGTSLEFAEQVAERLRRAIANARIPWKDTELQVSVSIGVATWEENLGREDLVDAADNALYVAKSDGRNRVVVAPSIHTQSSIKTANLPEPAKTGQS